MIVGFDTTLHYVLMLVAMYVVYLYILSPLVDSVPDRTFNAAYIISIILGVVIGQFAFGRLNPSAELCNT